ncbi:MAG: heavy-metal-associated domain-containing protein [Anaerolineales bacterium]
MALTLSSIRQLPGIIEVTGDLAAETVIVTYDSAQVTSEQIIKTIEDLDYTVEGTFEP